MADVDPSLFVKAVGLGGMSDDGNAFMLQFDLANGTSTPISFPAVAAASIFLGIQQQLGALFKKQQELLRGHDPRTFFPIGALKTSDIKGAFSQDGRPVMSVTLEFGIRLDFPVDPTIIPALSNTQAPPL